MSHYIPSFNNRRINLKRTRSKKPLWFLTCCAAVILSYFLLGFDFKTPDKDQTSSVDNKARVLTADATTSKPESAPVRSGSPFLPAAGEPAPEIEGFEEPASNIQEKTVSVSSGDTLMGLLVSQGLPRTEAHSIITSMKDVFNPRRLHQNHEIVLAFENRGENEPLLQSMNLKLDVTREVYVTRCLEKGFKAREMKHQLETRPVRSDIEINSSLYSAAVNTGMPIEILMQMIRAYSFDVDFQRDIRPGDRIEVLFQEKVDEYGEVVRGCSVLYATLTTRGRNLPIYRYETSDGEKDFFNAQGKSVRKTLMVTPIDGARLTSGYGMRRHPILGYSRMHPGLDFAAPTGTPIMAAGDGVVEYAGRKGNYGNYIRIRHPNEYHTVYAHMSRFASGIRSGARVRQGETIGYVGSTGMSTGPHLHYEVHHRGEHVNPATVDTPPGRTLEGQELERFMQVKDDLETLFASLETRDRLVRLDCLQVQD